MFLSFASISQTFEIYKADTINKTDYYNCKQGKWLLMGKHKPQACYKKDQLVEEGKYFNNRKEGLWVEYYCLGNIKSKIPFEDGKPKGHCIVYHQNGKVSEEGDYKNNRYIGIYQKFDTMGMLIHEMECDSVGKRIRSLFWLQDEKRYMIDSVINSKKHWSNGNYMIPQALNGKQTLYNKYRQITKDGIFQDNILMDGKAYVYDENHILIRIAIYKDGKYISDEPPKKIKEIKKNVDENGSPKKL